MPLVDKFPADMFSLRPGEKPMYGESPDLKRAVSYFKSLMREGEWVKRRESAAWRLYRSFVGELVDPTGKGKYFDDKDLFGWQLFLAEAFTDYPQHYELIYGARTIPVFTAIGRELERLTAIEGFRERAARLVGAGRSQPNGLLFEMLVAAAYARAGGKVTFRPENPLQKTYDLDVDLDGKRWAIECKRMEGGEYHEFERQRMRDLWQVPCFMFVKEKRAAIFDLNFKVELSEVPDDYLVSKSKKFLSRYRTCLMWDDMISCGGIENLDLGPLQQELERNYVMHPSPQFTKLLTGRYHRHDSMLSVHKAKLASNPHFIAELDFAVVARWSSASKSSIEKKARDILKRLAEANEQLPTDVPGIAHIGFEFSR